MVASSLLALALAYMIWYTAVQRIGSARTAVYSNLTPIVAMIVAAIWLGETDQRRADRRRGDDPVGHRGQPSAH